MKRFLPYALLFGLTVACFVPAIRYGLCPCDDAFYLLGCREIMDGLTLHGVRYAFSSIELCIWMPLTFVSYMFDYSVGWGYGGMHVQSMLWHAANAVLLYVLLTRLFPSCRLVSFLAALIWAVHPLRVESVVWLASRKDVISTFFLLAALLAWVRGSVRDTVVSQILVVIGAMAKPSVMVFPVFALAIDFLVTGRRKRAAAYWIAAGVAVLVAIEAQIAQTAGGAASYSAMIPLWYRMVNAIASVTVYLGNFAWPDNLAIQCMIRYPDAPRFSPVGFVILIAILVGGLFTLLPRYRQVRMRGDWNEMVRGRPLVNVAICGLFVFFAALVPFLGISGFGIHAFADRFTILPCIGLAFVCVALGVGRPRIVVPILGVAALALGAKCVHQVGFWRDGETILRHTLEVDREKNVDAQRVLGVYCWDKRHDMEETYDHLTKAMTNAWCDAVRDMVGVSCHLLIEAAYATGRKQEAEDWYHWMGKLDYRQTGKEKSLEYMMAEALWNLNSRKSGGLAEAERILAELRRDDPDGYLAKNVAYLIACKRGNRDEIVRALRECPCAPGTACSNVWAVKALRKFQEQKQSPTKEKEKTR